MPSSWAALVMFQLVRCSASMILAFSCSSQEPSGMTGFAPAREAAPPEFDCEPAAMTGSGRRSRTSRSEEHTSELQSRLHLVCRLLLEKKKKNNIQRKYIEL